MELTDVQRAFNRVVADVPKLQHKSNGRWVLIYSFARFLQQFEPPLPKDVLTAVRRMRSKGMTGLKHLKKHRGSGGSRAPAGKRERSCASPAME